MRRIKLSKDGVICPRCAGDENAILDTDGCTMCNGTGKIKKSDLRMFDKAMDDFSKGRISAPVDIKRMQELADAQNAPGEEK